MTGDRRSTSRSSSQEREGTCLSASLEEQKRDSSSEGNFWRFYVFDKQLHNVLLLCLNSTKNMHDVKSPDEKSDMLVLQKVHGHLTGKRDKKD